jgi:voltage-gated potassium channel
VATPDLSDRSVATLVVYRLRWALLGLLALSVIASAGYVLLEGYSVLDAIYMTVITLGTVGYGEVRPLGTGGRVLTMAVIVGGFATLVYMATVLTNLFASGEAVRHLQARRMRRMSEGLERHVIVVGFGRVGQAVAASLLALGERCVVIDRNPDHGAAITGAGALHIVGDATNEDDLRRAGVARADALVAATDTDAENLVVVLTARSIRADLRIVSRVNQHSWLRRITAAGADVAESPYESYGSILAGAAVAGARGN